MNLGCLLGARGGGPTGRVRLAVAVCLLLCLTAALPPRADAGPAQPATTGQATATVTTLGGTVPIPGVAVGLHTIADGSPIAQTLTDNSGHVAFPDVPPGRYWMRAARAGFVTQESAPFDVVAGASTDVALDVPLTFNPPPVQVVADGRTPLPAVPPVTMGDMLAGSVIDLAPLEGDDFQSLLPLLPGVVRGPDGRLRLKGGQPSQGALQISSASLVDPSTGDFDLDLPGQSIDSVEVLTNPFAAEYGRFSSSIVQIRTRRGTNEWEVRPGNLMPRVRGGLDGIRGFEPRLSVRGPLRRDRLFLSQDLQLRYVNTPVKSLPDEPEVRLTSFDSFTRFDAVQSSAHTVSGGLITFPRTVANAGMSTFRPPSTTVEFHQNGWAGALVDRLAIGPRLVLESTFAGRVFEVEATAVSPGAMVIAPQGQSGGFFNDQEREVDSVQWVEALSLSANGLGEHVFKVGTDLQRSHFDGFSESRPIEVRRLDGTLAERTTFGARSAQSVNGLELGVFAQDRWRIGARTTVELGIRIDRDAVIERLNWSPRVGVAIGVLGRGRGVIRGGVGKFTQRTPLNVGAFASYEPRTVTRYAADGLTPLGEPIQLRHVTTPGLRTPEAWVANLEWNGRFGRRQLLKVAIVDRRGSHEFVVAPEPAAGALRLSGDGRSRYQEFEITTRHLGGERKDVTVSYVWSRGQADLNHYDQFFGNLRTPLVRANEYGPIATDARHRLMVRGTIGLPGFWNVAPVLEVRPGFPWSAVDEVQDFAGPRNRSGRLPMVKSLDLAVVRPWRFRTYRFRAGLRVYNLFGRSAQRDIQNNLASPDYGMTFNPIERSIGLVFGSAR